MSKRDNQFFNFLLHIFLYFTVAVASITAFAFFPAYICSYRMPYSVVVLMFCTCELSLYVYKQFHSAVSATIVSFIPPLIFGTLIYLFTDPAGMLPLLSDRFSLTVLTICLGLVMPLWGGVMFMITVIKSKKKKPKQESQKPDRESRKKSTSK